MTEQAKASRPRTTTIHRNTHRTTVALELLAAGVPLSLLIDLATAVESSEVYATESGSAAWLVSV